MGESRVAPTPVVCQLTGLSTVKLREWTSRRALIPADVPPPKRGAAALYSWQTVLVLRVASVLRNAFHVELKAQKTLFDRLRAILQEQPFTALSGKRLVIGCDGRLLISDPAGLASGPSDCLILELDPHLCAIREAFELPQPARRKAAA